MSSFLLWSRTLLLCFKLLLWLSKFLNSFAMSERKSSWVNSMSILNLKRLAKTWAKHLYKSLYFLTLRQCRFRFLMIAKRTYESTINLCYSSLAVKPCSTPVIGCVAIRIFWATYNVFLKREKKERKTSWKEKAERKANYPKEKKTQMKGNAGQNSRIPN